MVAKILEGDLKPERGDAPMFFRKDRFSFRNPDPGAKDRRDKYVHYRISDVVELRWISEEPNEEAPGGVAGAVGALVGLVVGLFAGAGLVGSLGLGAAGFVLGLVVGGLGKALRWGSFGPRTKIVFGIEFHDGKTCSSRGYSKGLGRAGRCPRSPRGQGRLGVSRRRRRPGLTPSDRAPAGAPRVRTHPSPEARDRRWGATTRTKPAPRPYRPRPRHGRRRSSGSASTSPAMPSPPRSWNAGSTSPYAARTRGELLALEDDLPALGPANGPAFQAAEARPPVLIDTGRSGPERDLIVAIGSGTERKGGWTPARNLTALAMMGSVELDFREAVFTAPEIQLRAAVLMANVAVIVPPGVGVEWGGIALMGGVTTPERTGPPARDGPVVRIDGLVCMGGVEVVERLAGESAREARKRRRREKSARRRIDSGHDPYAGADR